MVVRVVGCIVVVVAIAHVVVAAAAVVATPAVTAVVGSYVHVALVAVVVCRQCHEGTTHQPWLEKRKILLLGRQNLNVP